MKVGTIRSLATLLVVLGACGDDDGSDPDRDGGPTDASIRVDSGPRDAGPPMDAPDTDAGPGDRDAGPADVDGGPPDPDGGPGDRDAGPPPPDAGPPIDVGPPPCRTPSDCQDGLYCNGYEGCAPGTPGADARGCVAGTAPCTSGSRCDETEGRCVYCGSCTSAADCGDGVTCNGAETCAAGMCGLATPIDCAGSSACVEPSGACGCTVDANCSDGIRCNGTERCVGGTCRPGTAVACAAPESCIEHLGTCGRRCPAGGCDDGLYCNGTERCDSSGLCVRGTSPCGTRGCNETTNRCRCTTSAECDNGRYCESATTFATEGCNTSGECVSFGASCTGSQQCYEGVDMCRLPPTCVRDSDCSVTLGCTACAGGRCLPCARVDADGDGHDSVATGGDDCDDADPNRFTGNPEVCDPMRHDEDCDSATYGRRDMDGDGFDDADCCNNTTCGNDCDDARGAVHPTAVEACNEIDDDCDDYIDEMVLARFFLDRDRDGAGDTDCGNASQRCSGAAGYAAAGGDCDDSNPAIRVGTTVCDPAGTGVRICRDGAWMATACPAGTSCRPQPDGTGLCL